MDSNRSSGAASSWVDSATLPEREILDYLELPFRRPWLVIAPLVLAAAGAAIAYRYTPREYTSATLIQIQRESIPETLAKGKAVVKKPTSTLRRIDQEVNSRTRLERIVQELNPYPRFENSRSSKVIDKMRDSVRVSVKSSGSFYITFSHSNPHMAMTVTNRLATLYIEESARAREETVLSALDFLEGQVEETKRTLEEKEIALQRLNTENIGALPQQLLSNLGVLQGLSTEKQSLAERINTASVRRRDIELALTEMTGRGPDGVPLRRATEAETELTKAKNLLAELRLRYTDVHPEVRRLRKSVELLEARAKESASPSGETAPGTVATVDPAVAALRSKLSEFDLELQTLRQRQIQLDERSDTLQRNIERAPLVEQEILAVTRDYDLVKASYTDLLKRKGNTELTRKLEQKWQREGYRILDPASIPDWPSKPKPLRFALFGLGLGLSTAVGSLLLFDLLDHSVRNLRELEVVVPHPVLASVPHIRAWQPPRIVRRYLAGPEPGVR